MCKKHIEKTNNKKEGLDYGPVSYTHLDVYKRQVFDIAPAMLSQMTPEELRAHML